MKDLSNCGIRWSIVSAREKFSPSSFQTLSDNLGGMMGHCNRLNWVSVIVHCAPWLLAEVHTV